MGPYRPYQDHACVPDKADGGTPNNQTVRCNWVQDSRKPGNDSYDKLAQNPYAYDSAVVRHLCHHCPVSQNYKCLVSSTVWLRCTHDEKFGSGHHT